MYKLTGAQNHHTLYLHVESQSHKEKKDIYRTHLQHCYILERRYGAALSNNSETDAPPTIQPAVGTHHLQQQSTHTRSTSVDPWTRHCTWPPVRKNCRSCKRPGLQNIKQVLLHPRITFPTLSPTFNRWFTTTAVLAVPPSEAQDCRSRQTQHRLLLEATEQPPPPAELNPTTAALPLSTQAPAYHCQRNPPACPQPATQSEGSASSPGRAFVASLGWRSG